jgi:hypothetical protein
VSVTGEILSVVKKIFLVSEELTRLSAEVKELSKDVIDHEVRLAVIENTLSIAKRSSSRLTLPGN